MSNLHSYLTALNDDPLFQEVTRLVLLPGIPEIPRNEFDPETGRTNLEQWKYTSAWRDGYLSALEKLGVSYSNDRPDEPADE